MIPTNCDNCGVCCAVNGNQVVAYAMLAYNPKLAAVWDRQDDVARLPSIPQDAIDAVEASDIEDKVCAWMTPDGRCRWYEHRPGICRDVQVGGECCLESREKAGINQGHGAAGEDGR